MRQKKISCAHRLDNESLMSLLARTCIDIGAGWGYFQRRILGATFRSARLAERRYFLWDQLESVLDVPSFKLFAMSERSFFVGQDNPVTLSRLNLRHFPWANEIGYSCYSPAALERSQHWRLSWLLPANFIDVDTGTLFLIHCPHCGADLGKTRWRTPLPLCPDCSTGLWTAPIIEAPPKIARWVESTGRFKLGEPPFDPCSASARSLAAVFNVAQLLELPEFRDLLVLLLDQIDVGALIGERSSDMDAQTRAIRRIQIWAASTHACAEYHEVMWRDQFVEPLPRNLTFARRAFSKGLRELAARFDVEA